MIAHYRKSRDKSYGIVIGEATGLLRGDSEAVAGEVTEPLRRDAGDREDISDS